MLCLILICFYISGLMANNEPIVQTSLGKVKGIYKTSFEGRVYLAFEGIPYAKPPIGNLRFEAPQPVSSWNNVLNSNAKHACKQVDNPFEKAKQSEDCLYLNVYVPNTRILKNASYDVLVNIHGGAFMIGSTSFVGPYYLIDRDIVYVNFNYRLGILGFLSTEDKVVPGNNGLKDQQMALKWIQSHIKNFGGNPNSVTLMGASAGGASVHFHYFSPQSQGLFHRGISQSGNALMPWAFQENALEKTKKVAESVNCENSNREALVDCLKAVDVNDLMKESKTFYDLYQFPFAPFAPVVEVNTNSSFLTKHPYSQLINSEMYDVPWLTWITKDEGMIAVIALYKILDEVEKNWNNWSEHMFDYRYVCSEARKKTIAENIKYYYFKNDKVSENNIKSLVEAFSDRLFKTGYETALEMQARVASSPIYAAIYSYIISVHTKLIGKEFKGVWHGADGFLLHDLESVMPIQRIRLSESDILMKNVIIDFLTSFAKDSTPKSNEVEWKPFRAMDRNYLVINGFNNLSMTEIHKLSAKEFWNSLDFTENK